MAKILFDFDGVLVRSRGPQKTFLWSQHLEADLGISSQIQREIFEPKIWHSIITGQTRIESHLESVFRSNNLALSPEKFVSYWLTHDMNWRKDILVLARDLKAGAHHLFIATNQDRVRGECITRNPMIVDIFKNVYTSNDLRVAKPDLNFFISLNERLSVQKNEMIIFIDDDHANVSAAESVGWIGILFDPDLNPSDTIDGLRAKLNQIT